LNFLTYIPVAKVSLKCPKNKNKKVESEKLKTYSRHDYSQIQFSDPILIIYKIPLKNTQESKTKRPLNRESENLKAYSLQNYSQVQFIYQILLSQKILVQKT